MAKNLLAKIFILYWTAVSLTFLLPPAGGMPAVENHQLSHVVTDLLNRYTPSYNIHGSVRRPMFSLVVSVPRNTNTGLYDTSAVTDNSGTVRYEILNCDVYVGRRVVAATVLRWPNVLDQCPRQQIQWRLNLRKCRSPPRTWAEVQSMCPRNTIPDGTADHAEFRTLQNIGTLVSNHREGSNDLLFFYVLASPCDKRCTSETSQWNILQSIKSIRKWTNYAVVFTNIFVPRNGAQIPDQEREEALRRLGNSVGLDNIFRCFKDKGKMKCINCSSSGEVARPCYSNE